MSVEQNNEPNPQLDQFISSPIDTLHLHGALFPLTIRSLFRNLTERAFTLTTFFPYGTSFNRWTMIASAWVFLFSFFSFNETTNHERYDVSTSQVLSSYLL